MAHIKTILKAKEIEAQLLAQNRVEYTQNDATTDLACLTVDRHSLLDRFYWIRDNVLAFEHAGQFPEEFKRMGFKVEPGQKPELDFNVPGSSERFVAKAMELVKERIERDVNGLVKGRIAEGPASPTRIPLEPIPLKRGSKEFEELDARFRACEITVDLAANALKRMDTSLDMNAIHAVSYLRKLIGGMRKGVGCERESGKGGMSAVM